MSDDLVTFKEVALWAKAQGASHLAVKDGHYEIAFFMDPRVFAGNEKPVREMTDAEKEDAAKRQMDAAARRLFRST